MWSPDEAAIPVGSSVPFSGASPDISAVASTIAFPSVGIVAPFGTVVELLAACSRQEGGPTALLRAQTSILDFVARWGDGDGIVTNVLYNTARDFSVAIVSLLDRRGSATTTQLDWPANASLPQCTLELAQDDVAAGFNINPTSATLSPTGRGVLSLAARKPTPPYGSISLKAVCLVLGTTTVTPIRGVYVQRAVATWHVEPPATIVPSTSASVLRPLLPVPQVRIITDRGEAVDASDVVCELEAFPASPGVPVFAVGVTTSAGQRTWGYNSTFSAIALSLVGVTGPWGTTVNLNVSCTRQRSGEVAVRAYHPIRMTPLAPSWIVPPPSSISVGVPFLLNVSIDSVAAFPPSRQTDENFALCSLSVEPAARLSGDTAAARDGIVVFPAAAIIGTRGLTYNLTLTCFLGGMPLVVNLASNVTLPGCPAGWGATPEGACTQCRDGQYATGGAGACFSCAAMKGLTCHGQRVVLSPGFYHPALLNRAANGTVNQAGSFMVNVSVTEDMELHQCLNDEACIVDSATMAYGCAPWYTGPLCGVCKRAEGFAPASNNVCRQCFQLPMLIVLSVTMGAVVLVFFIYRINTAFNADSWDRHTSIGPVFSIIVVFATTMSTLSRLYVLRPSALARSIVGWIRSIVLIPIAIIDSPQDAGSSNAVFSITCFPRSRRCVDV